MKKIVTGMIFFIVSLVSYSLNFSVYPVRVDADFQKVTTHEITLTNNTLEPLRIEAYPEADKSFGEKYNLNDKIVLFPKVVSIKPGASQKLRFRVKPDSEMKNGEYKSFITFREIPSEIKNTAKEEKSGTITSNVRFITEISIPVYSLGKNQVVDGNLTNVGCKSEGNTLNLKGKSVSKGNTSLIFDYVLDVIGLDVKLTGKLGSSAREGEKDISLNITTKESLKGKKAKLKITDQTGKVHFNKEVTL